jgi:hypothetical protein
MDMALTFRDHTEGRVDLIAGDSTKCVIAALQLHRLQDDRG